MFSEQDFVQLDATDEDEAVLKFVRARVVNDEAFRDHIADKSVGGFADRFWRQAKVVQARAAGSNDQASCEEEFKNRISAFFGDNVEFASEYLDFFFGKNERTEMNEYGVNKQDRRTVDGFSAEMLFYIAIHLEWARVTVFLVNELEVL